MSKRKNQGVSEVERIEVNEIRNMRKNEEVLVNKIRINSQLSKLERSKKDEEAVVILCEILNEAMCKERIKNKISMSVSMSVENIVKCFKDDIESLPKNTFLKKVSAS
ncbi:hypothetical protein [Anaeromicropila herbilytica]|uniref:Uncharacterized protein n=1 Tax=Anaeromicropila herbilytica TaxID=2785025 RepID=A0A7R7IET4_9FIRM|nr:hypothetical protein [Anaeromicropila herbilytica]BCN32449.1 hypothetical protein bsdtb5_37440 [Anaeromicropila herbilytica]